MGLGSTNPRAEREKKRFSRVPSSCARQSTRFKE